MAAAATPAHVSSDGFLILDAKMYPIFVNSPGAAILAYPDGTDSHRNFAPYIAEKIRSILILGKPSNESAFVSKFKSGRRYYSCRSFPVSGMGSRPSEAAYALILERAVARTSYLIHLEEKFHLTTREREVAQLLLQGLTSKEIGLRMQISPNTVKAFLRLIMVKMGVSTRSGIVGKAFTSVQ